MIQSSYALKPTMMVLAATSALATESPEITQNPGAVAMAIAALVAVVYWMMRLIDRFMVEKTAKSDPAVKVLTEIRDCLAPMEQKIDKIHESLDIPHPYNPGMKAFADHVRQNLDTTLSLARQNARNLERLRKELQAYKATSCPVKSADADRLLDILRSVPNGGEFNGDG